MSKGLQGDLDGGPTAVYAVASDASPSPPRSLAFLRELRLRHTSITDRNLGQLAARVKTLELLDVSGVTTLTEVGFLALLNMPRLETLVARATAITDIAVANIILCLEVCSYASCRFLF